MDRPTNRTRQLALLTEDAYGLTDEMGSRLASGIWPTPQTTQRVIRRCNEMIPALRALRRELQRGCPKEVA